MPVYKALFEHQIDGLTDAVMVIDYAHHEIHSGSHFKAGEQNTALATGDKIEIVFTTPNSSKEAHWVLTSQTTGECVVEVFLDATLSSDGTAVAVKNRNQNSTNTADVIVTHTPTISSDGTKWSEKWVGATGWKTDIGATERGSSEIILKSNTKTLVRLTAVGNGIKGAIGGDWYEHTQSANAYDAEEYSN